MRVVSYAFKASLLLLTSLKLPTLPLMNQQISNLVNLVNILYITKKKRNCLMVVKLKLKYTDLILKKENYNLFILPSKISMVLL